MGKMSAWDLIALLEEEKIDAVVSAFDYDAHYLSRAAEAARKGGGTLTIKDGLKLHALERRSVREAGRDSVRFVLDLT